MSELANALVHASWLLLPEELRDRYEGNTAIDATFVPLYGKSGNPSSKILNGDRRTANPDGGWYRREGDHGAVTHADARALKKTDPKGNHKGTSARKLFWGIEAEIARMTPNHLAERDQFPLLTTALGFHIPGAVSGEGLRLLESLVDRGHNINLYIMDRAYSNGIYSEFQVPARLLGVKLVFDYKKGDLGLKASDTRGFIQVSGSWYLDSLPQVHRDADAVVLAARTKHGESAGKLAKAEVRFAKLNAAKTGTGADSPNGEEEVDEEELTMKAARAKYGPGARLLAQAEDLYAKQLERREFYRLKPKGHMSPDGTRRYLIPEPSKENGHLKTPHRYTQKTVMMKLPLTADVDPDDANPGGLKHEQHFAYGAEHWRAVYGMRNGVESVNRNIKRSQYEDIANPDKRAVRGNTFTYLVITLATVVENIRQTLSFYKRKLALNGVTAKNRELPGTFWQSADPTTTTEPGPQPPG